MYKPEDPEELCPCSPFNSPVPPAAILTGVLMGSAQTRLSKGDLYESAEISMVG